MKKTLIFNICCMLLAGVGWAQESDKPFFDPMQQRDHVGFNINIVIDKLFDQAYTTPLQLLYKHQLKKQRALRLSTTFSFQKTYQTTVGNKETTITNLYTNLSIGLEWQNTLSKRWLWFYGIDVIPQYSFQRHYGENVTDSFQTDDFGNYLVNTKDDNFTYAIAGRPFVGIRFHITPRIYVATEAGFSIQYGITRLILTGENVYFDGRVTKSNNRDVRNWFTSASP